VSAEDRAAGEGQRGEVVLEAYPVDALRRWERAGAIWRVVRWSGGVVTIALLTCDGGEQVAQLRCAEAVVDEFLAGRLTNAVD
jgi:hypothetical protein